MPLASRRFTFREDGENPGVPPPSLTTRNTPGDR
jgi:hypothetical protein